MSTRNRIFATFSLLFLSLTLPISINYRGTVLASSLGGKKQGSPRDNSGDHRKDAQVLEKDILELIVKFLNKKISAEEMKSIGELARLVAIMISSVNLEFDRRDHTAEPTPHITRLRELLRDMHQGFRDLDWLDDFILEIGLACHELVICTVANFDDFILTIGSVERLYSSTYEAYKNFVKIGKRDVPDLFDMLASSLKSIIESILSENAMSDEERIRLVEMSRASSKSLSSARLLSNKNATDGEKYMKKLAETSRASSKPLLSTKLPSSVNLNDVVSHSPAKPEENDWRKNIREETKKKLAELEKKFRDRKKEKEDDKLIELDVTRNKRSKETVLKLINVIICVLVRENLEWSHISTYVYANSGFERMTTCAPIVHRIVYFISAIKIMLSKLDVAPRTGTEPDGTGQNADSSGFGTEATFRQKLAGINSDFGKLMDSLDELNNMIWANSPTLSNPLAALNNFLHSLFLIFCSISELDEHLAYSKRKYLSNVLRFYMLFAMKYLYRNGNATSFSENFLKLIGQKIGMEHVKIVLGDLFIGYLDTENLDIASHGLNIEALPVPLDTLGPLCAENIRDRILRFLGNVLKIEPMAYEILNLELFAQSIEHLISLLKNNPLTSNDIFNSRFHALLKSYILDSNDTLDWLEKLIFEIDDMCVEMEKCPARVPYGNMPEILDVRQSVLAMNQIFIDYYYEGRPESVSPPRKPINGLNLFILHTFLRMYKKTYGRQLPMMLTPKELLDLKGQLNSVSQSVGEPTLSGMKFAEKAKEPNSVGKTKAGPASANHKSPSAARKESEISKNLKRCTAFLERTENRVFSILSSIFIKSHGEQKLRTIAKIIMDEFEFVVSYLLDPKTIPGKSTEELEVISKLSFEVMWLLEKVDGGKSEFGHGELGPLIHWLSYVYTSLLGSEGEILQKDYLRNGLLQVLIFSIDSLGMTPGFRLEWVENIAHLFYSTMIANRMGRKFLSKDQITILLTIGEQRPSIFFGESGQILSISTESGKKSKRKKKDKNPEVTDLSGIGDTGTEKTSGVRSEIDLERIRLKILDLIYHILFVRQIMSYDHIGYDALATSIVLLIAAIEPELPESTKNPERHYRNDTLATPIVFLGSAVKIKSLEPAQNSRPTAKIWEETGHGGIFGTPIWAHIVAMLDIFGKINIVTTDKALNSEFKLKKLINILGTTAKAIERMDINPKSRIVQKYKVNMFSLYLKFVGKYLELGGASDIQLEYTDLDIPSEVGSSVALNPLSRFSGASMLKFVMENLSKNPTLNITIMEGRKIRRFVELLATLVYKLESSLSLFDINLYFCFSSILKNTFPNSDDLNWLKKFIYILGLFMSKNTECMNNLSKILGSVSITNPEWLTTKVIDDFSSAGTNDTYGSKEEETDLMTLLRIISVNYAIFSLRYLSEAPSWILILGPKSGYKRSLEVLNLVEERRGFFIHTDLRKEFLDMKRQFQVASRDKENSKIEKDKIAKIKDELRLDIINRFISKGKIPHILYDDDVESTVNPVVDELFYIRKTLYGLEPIKPIIDTEIAKIVEEVDIIINLYLNTSSLSGSNRNGLKGIITWLSSICLNIRDKLSTSINVLLIDKLYEYHMKTLTSYAFFVQNNLDSEVLEWLTSSFKVLFKANMGLSTEDNELTKLCSLLKKGGSGWSSVMESEPIHNILVRDTQTLKIYMLNLFQKILPNDFKTKASDKDVDYMGKFLDDIIAELSNMNEIIKYCGKIALADPKKSPKYTEKALNVHEWFVLYAGMLNIGSNRPEFDDIVYWIFEFATELLEGSDSVSTGIFVKLLIKIESSYSSLITKYNLHRPVWMDEVASILESDGLITNEDTASLGVEVYSYSYSGFFGKKNVRRTLERFFNKNTEGKTVSLEKLSRIIGKFTDSVVCLVSIMKTSRVTERDSSALVRFYSILKNRTPSSSNLEWLFGLVQDIVLFRKQFNFSVEIRSLVFDFCQQCIVPILGHWTDPEWILTLERGDILHVDSMNSINLTLKKHKVLVRILQTVLKSSTEQFDTDEQLDSGEKTHKHEKGLGEERMELQEEELAEKGRENDEKKGAEENRKKEEEKKEEEKKKKKKEAEEEKKKKEKEERKERRKEKNKNREKIDEEEIEEMERKEEENKRKKEIEEMERKEEEEEKRKKEEKKRKEEEKKEYEMKIRKEAEEMERKEEEKKRKKEIEEMERKEEEERERKIAEEEEKKEKRKERRRKERAGEEKMTKEEEERRKERRKKRKTEEEKRKKEMKMEEGKKKRDRRKKKAGNMKEEREDIKFNSSEKEPNAAREMGVEERIGTTKRGQSPSILSGSSIFSSISTLTSSRFLSSDSFNSLEYLSIPAALPGEPNLVGLTNGLSPLASNSNLAINNRILFVSEPPSSVFGTSDSLHHRAVSADSFYLRFSDSATMLLGSQLTLSEQNSAGSAPTSSSSLNIDSVHDNNVHENLMSSHQDSWQMGAAGLRDGGQEGGPAMERGQSLSVSSLGFDKHSHDLPSPVPVKPHPSFSLNLSCSSCGSDELATNALGGNGHSVMTSYPTSVASSSGMFTPSDYSAQASQSQPSAIIRYLSPLLPTPSFGFSSTPASYSYAGTYGVIHNARGHNSRCRSIPANNPVDIARVNPEVHGFTDAEYDSTAEQSSQELSENQESENNQNESDENGAIESRSGPLNRARILDGRSRSPNPNNTFNLELNVLFLGNGPK